MIYVHHHAKLKLLNITIIETESSPFRTVQIQNPDQANIPGCFCEFKILTTETCIATNANDSRT
jgi:hypothetical protein